MKKIKSVKEAAYGFKTYYVIKYIDGKSEIVHYLTKEMEKHLHKE